jgi:hypothetical protein
MIGKHCLVTHVYYKTVSVTGYDPKMGSMQGMQVISAALAYVDPSSGETLILRVHQAVHIPTMMNNLLCPMQMRLNDVIVDDCPKFLHHNPTDTTHTLTIKDGSDTLVIPLSIRGVTSYFPTRAPTVAENDTCRSFDLTFSNPEWNPSSNAFEQQEESQTDSYGRIQDPGDRPRNFFISDFTSELNGPLIPAPCYTSQCSAILMEIEPSLDDQIFYQMLKANVQVQSTTTSRQKGVMTAERLAKNWCISLEAAKRTLEVTTQQGIRTVANPLLSRRFRTNDRQLRYRRLRADMFTDTAETRVPSQVTRIYGRSTDRPIHVH